MSSLTQEFGNPLFWAVAKVLVMARNGQIVAGGTDAELRLKNMKEEFMGAAGIETIDALDAYLDAFDSTKVDRSEEGRSRREVSRYLATVGIR
jgi:hypothetical protein